MMVDIIEWLLPCTAVIRTPPSSYQCRSLGIELWGSRLYFVGFFFCKNLASLSTLSFLRQWWRGDNHIIEWCSDFEIHNWIFFFHRACSKWTLGSLWLCLLTSSWSTFWLGGCCGTMATAGGHGWCLLAWWPPVRLKPAGSSTTLATTLSSIAQDSITSSTTYPSAWWRCVCVYVCVCVHVSCMHGIMYIFMCVNILSAHHVPTS